MSDKLLEGDAALGHLLRRAGFGMTPDQFDAYRKLGYRRAVRRLLDELGDPVPADPEGFDPYVPGAIQQLWLDRMHGGRSPLAEKLALFWHGHFATSDAKIQEPHLMWAQYKLFRGQGDGKFRELVEKVSRDVAMIRWLDSNANRKGAANENYARELQELFTLGIGNYTETDIREIARAFTGWASRHHDFVYTESFHDAGEKVVHGERGAWNGDDVVRIITGLPASRTFIAGKLLRFFSHPDPTDAEIAALAEVLQKTDGDIRATLFVIFHSPEFRATAHHRVLVRSPVEFQIGALRAAKVDAVPRWSHGALDRMGQILFRPPSVKGWTSGTGWLTAASVVERFKAARRIADAAPEAAEWIVQTALDGVVPDALAKKLEGTKGKDKVAMALASPEFQLV